MVGRTAPILKADRARFQLMQEIGCSPCHKEGLNGVPPDVNHLLEAGRRIGHQATVAECPWHHRGIPPGDIGAVNAEIMFGPSRARNKRAYRDRYGTDAELLAYQNELIEREKGLKV